jgi:hypothetical protein
MIKCTHGLSGYVTSKLFFMPSNVTYKHNDNSQKHKKMSWHKANRGMAGRTVNNTFLEVSIKYPPPSLKTICVSWITLTTGQLPNHWLYVQVPTLHTKKDVYCQQEKYGWNRLVANTRLTCAMLAICFTKKITITYVKAKNLLQKDYLITSTHYMKLVSLEKKYNKFLKNVVLKTTKKSEFHICTWIWLKHNWQILLWNSNQFHLSTV